MVGLVGEVDILVALLETLSERLVDRAGNIYDGRIKRPARGCLVLVDQLSYRVGLFKSLSVSLWKIPPKCGSSILLQEDLVDGTGYITGSNTRSVQNRVA